MKTSIEFINHASVIVTGGGVSILSDPWFEGAAFNNGWNLLYENDDDYVQKMLGTVTHIWISHEHPDHFSIQFFKKFGALIKKNSITIMFRETRDRRVLSYLESQSHLCLELGFNRRVWLSRDVSIICMPDGFYDSALLIDNCGERILNLNDCDVSSVSRAREMLSHTGRIDVLLTQFSYAAWKGGKVNSNWRSAAAKEKLDAMLVQARCFQPKVIVPFASFVYFSNAENFYLNDSINKPNKVLTHFEGLPFRVVVMKPGDVLGGVAERTSTNLALEFWDRLYDDLGRRELKFFETVPLSVLKENFQKSCARISNNNSLWLMRFIRALSPIRALKPVLVELTDLDCCVKFDYLNKNFSTTDDPPQLRMHSQSLNFMFINSFGFDTLVVNGCFEEGRKGGFISASKTLAIDNLNNLGFHLRLRGLISFGILRVFLTRLGRASKKING
jgi:UDP-MurNAc hydroxylase